MWMFFFFKQKTAYEIRKGDWSSDVCSSDLPSRGGDAGLLVLPHDKNPKPDEISERTGVAGPCSASLPHSSCSLALFWAEVRRSHSNAFQRSRPTSTPPIRKKQRRSSWPLARCPCPVPSNR